MAKKSDIVAGDDWAYRIGAADPILRVQVVALNAIRTSQVKVVFLTGQDLGVTGEVPITRLKARWVDREAYLVREHQWAQLVSAPEEIEEEAVTAIVREFLWPAAQVNAEKARRGTVAIYDEELVDVFVGGVLERVLTNSPSIREEGGAAHYGWPVALELSKRVAARKADQVMAYVHAEEAKARPHGDDGSRRAQVDATYYDGFLRPMLNLIRNWCGEASADAHDEIRKLRSDVTRFETFFAGAIALLVDAGQEAAAWEINRVAYPKAKKKVWALGVAAEAHQRAAWRAKLTK